MKDKRLFWIAPLVAMGIGLLPMPYEYYTLSRLVVCVGALYFTVSFIKGKKIESAWIFGAIAALYNPIFQIHLGDKGLWTIVNIVTAILFWRNRSELESSTFGNED